MKSFEEKFPSLIKLTGKYGMGESVNIFDIQKFCLDKARVREAIKEYWKTIRVNMLNDWESLDDDHPVRKLAFALGLEDET